MVVYFDLTLTNKYTPPQTGNFEIIWDNLPDTFLFSKCSRSKMLEQLF